MDGITNSVALFHVSNMVADDLSDVHHTTQHPRFGQFKKDSIKTKSQEERRRQLLDDQRKSESDLDCLCRFL